MATVRANLDRLKAIFPNRDDRGFMYARAVSMRLKFSKITVHTLLVSQEAQYTTYRTIINKKKKPKTVPQWHDWLRDNFDNVMRGGVLPAMHNATSVAWSVLKIIGWHVNAERKPSAPAVGRAGHKTKRKRVKRGKDNLRRRHRNKRRRAAKPAILQRRLRLRGSNIRKRKKRRA